MITIIAGIYSVLPYWAVVYNFVFCSSVLCGSFVMSCICVLLLFGSCRNVTDSDLQNQEKRLLQTMDMIISKKKR